MRLYLLKTAESGKFHMEENGLAHGTRVIKELALPGQEMEGLLWQTHILYQWRPPKSCIVLDCGSLKSWRSLLYSTVFTEGISVNRTFKFRGVAGFFVTGR
jgi:hypothetical protein